MIVGIFEALMLACFAAAWPFSIYRSYVSRTTQGKSVLFEYIAMLGYVCGIINKIVSHDINYVMVFYLIDLLLVIIDVALYFRNRHIEKVEGPQYSLKI